MFGVLSLELSTIRICPAMPARLKPSLHQSTNSPTVISSFKAGTTMVMSTDAVALPLGMRWVIAVGSATGGVAAALATFQFLAHCHHGIPQGPSAATPAAPAKAHIFRATNLHARHIAHPPGLAS